MTVKDIISEVNRQFFEKSTPNVSISGIIYDEVQKLGAGSPLPSTYYYLTDLTNPQQRFWKAMSPKIKKSSDLTKKLLMGDKIQHKFSNCFRALPGFTVEEGLLDGAYVDIPRVRGKVDYIIDGSIIELKTKGILPNSIDYIFEKHPNDLEQLVFYSALHPNKPEKNVLLFMGDKPPYNIKAFEVKTKDFNAVKFLIRERIKLLDNALSGKLSDKEFKKIGKCRYFEHGCEYHENGACSCEKIDSMDLSKLKQSIEIKEDKEFEKKFNKEKEKIDLSKLLEIYPNNIIAPRQQFMRNVLGLNRKFEKSNEKYVNETCLFSAIYRSKLTNLSDEEKKSTREKLFDERLNVPFRWMKIPSSSSREMIVPFITFVGFSEKMPYKPFSYHITLLGVICASHGLSKGLIVSIHPKIKKAVNVFEIKFKDNEIKNMQNLIRTTIGEIESAQKEEHLNLLHTCPEFMDKELNCPVRDKCKAIDEYCR